MTSMVLKAESKGGSGRGRGRPRHGDAPDPVHVARIALAAFAASGYDGASVREIAAIAAVDPALITRRYGSKLGLWKATVDQLAERMETLHAALADLDDDPAPFRHRFRHALRLFVAFCCEVPELGRFFTDEIARSGERRDYVMECIWRPNFAALRPLLYEARERGLVCTDDPDILIFQLVGMVAMPLMMQSVMAQELGAGSDAIQKRLTASVERMFLACPGEATSRKSARPEDHPARVDRG